MSFLLPFFQRILSGCQNAFGYSSNKLLMFIVSLCLILYPFLTFQHTLLFYSYLTINLLVVSAKYLSFNRKLGKFGDIHFWENLTTGGYFLFMILSNHNIVLLILSVYPALILHKGFINLGSNQHFLYEGTDDVSGKTYNLPLLGIKINRSSLKFRLLAASISIVLAIICVHQDISFKLSNLM